MSAITILDGGMGKELRRIGAPFRQPEWSALALLEDPASVAKAHSNFIDAGAEVIITNTYAVVPFHIGADRFERRGRELVELAARLAREAADESGRDVKVAGSLPPLFGSYDPANFDPDAAPELWRTLIEPQIPHVDLWVGETISSIEEARVLLDTLRGVDGDGEAAGYSKPVWLSFTVYDAPSVDAHAVADADDDANGRIDEPALRSGEPMSALADFITSAAHIDAVLFNCSQPEAIGPALAGLRPLLPGVRLGAYANAFADHNADSDTYFANEHVLERRADLTSERYTELAAEWVMAGASIVGGCCDIYPEHIAALAARFG